MPFVPRLIASDRAAAPETTEPSAGPVSRYRSLNPDEAAFTETMVNVLCPADHLTQDGVTCGLAIFVDRQLAGGFDAAAAQSTHAAREQLFKAGIAAANAACQERFGVRFDRLAPSDARRFLRDIAAGRVTDAPFPLASWSTEIVDPLLVRACFAGPVYAAYGSKLFWKLFG
jgi:gluconate 2-dehydrogenase gamma chain